MCFIRPFASLKIELRSIFPFYVHLLCQFYLAVHFVHIAAVMHLQPVFSAPFGRAGSLRSLLEVRFAFFRSRIFRPRFFPVFPSRPPRVRLRRARLLMCAVVVFVVLCVFV